MNKVVLLDIKAVNADVTQLETDAVVVNLFEGVTSPDGATGAVDKALGGLISELIGSGEIRGLQSETTLIHTPVYAYPDFKPARVLVLGLGESDSFDHQGTTSMASDALLPQPHARCALQVSRTFPRSFTVQV